MYTNSPADFSTSFLNKFTKSGRVNDSIPKDYAQPYDISYKYVENSWKAVERLLKLAGKYCQFNVSELANLTVEFCPACRKENMPKRTYQPKKRQRAREYGFIKRMANRTGRHVLNRRRQKGRKQLSH